MRHRSDAHTRTSHPNTHSLSAPPPSLSLSLSLSLSRTLTHYMCTYTQIMRLNVIHVPSAVTRVLGCTCIQTHHSDDQVRTYFSFKVLLVFVEREVHERVHA